MPKATNAGGKRQGSGRKTKPVLTALAPVEPTDSDIIRHFDSESTKVSFSAYLMAIGEPIKQIAVAAGVHRDTLYEWKKKSDYQALVQQFRQEITTNLINALQELSPEVVGVVRRHLEGGNLAAAKLVLEYTQPKQPVAGSTVNINTPAVTIVMGQQTEKRYIEQDSVDGEFTVQGSGDGKA